MLRKFNLDGNWCNWLWKYKKKNIISNYPYVYRDPINEKKKKKKWKLLIISGEKNNSYRTEMEFRIVSIRTGLEKKLHGTESPGI